MSNLCCNPTVFLTDSLAHWLVSTGNKKSICAKFSYHAAGRVALTGASLLSLIEAVVRIALGCISLSTYLITCGCWKQMKQTFVKQMNEAATLLSISFHCFYSILLPKTFISEPSQEEPNNVLPNTMPRSQLAHQGYPLFEEPLPPLTANMRNWRIRTGAERIAAKLEKQFTRAQKQARQERDKPFQYFVAPTNFQGEAHKIRVGNCEVGVCHFIGRRPAMEDEHLVTHFNLFNCPVSLFGIFDGHGGKAASRYVKANLENKLRETLQEFCAQGLSDERIWNALKITFAKLHAEFPESESGTTAAVAMCLDKKLWVANVGDSRVILSNGIQLSEDAKPTDPYYLKGIQNRGDLVYNERINGMLAVARAVGDNNVGSINARPKITVYPFANISPDTILELACDGIHDVGSARQLANSLAAHKEQPVDELAKNIVYSAFKAGSGDNLSVLIVKFIETVADT